MSKEVVRARWGVVLLFWLNGVAWSSIVPRFPEIKTALDASNTAFGLAVGLGPVGGLVAGLFTARLVRRYSSAGVAAVTQLIGIAGLSLVANAPTLPVFAASLAFMAAMDAFTDIAMNAHGLRVQKLYGRSILNSFHGWWSIGAVCGGFLGSVAAQAGMPLWIQALAATFVFGGLSLFARTMLLPGKDGDVDGGEAATRARPQRRVPAGIWVRLIALGLLGASVGLVEDSAASWGAIYMDNMFAVIPFVAGLAFVALQGAQMIGRFTGDAVVNRIGARPAVTLGVSVAAVGMALAVAFPSPVSTVIGFACAGWGIATGIPSAMNAANELPGMAVGSGLTFVTWLMRVGFFAGPPLIGIVGDAVGLRWALIVVPVAAVLALALTPALTPPRSARPEVLERPGTR
ncbi:Predicted arabinose efflux permease, MFS family [Tessaracoccus bendigoensis DSM 12906]|uniref:Predicted arabinose efflux permease, MFS family n=1 Tax=Tessaracoccus bendigoensis DSM 12906 TaxID=1123357 RepID=A0A1M6B5F3_9ACTN|nr:MFS transporter [Tessaracoccus bendigoensis]SHI43972.1 Predicted arabinose efflux permease, MFS family [Tessaracoccus bendigoensis DSM 12906]